MMRLKEKVAIVTGGGKGIGKAIALAFAEEGAKVVVAARTLPKLEETVEEIKRLGGQAKAIQTDVKEEKQVERMVSETVDTFGRIDILVNNSGIGGPTARVVDMNLDEWNEVIALDLTGSMLCCKHVLKYMIPRKSGNIINIGAEGGRAGDGRAGYPMRSPYCCAKMGVIGLTETLSIEVGEFNIRVNAISPAAVRGERIINVVKGRAQATGVPFEELMAKIVQNYSLGRMTEEREVASVAVFLASDESSAITGQTIVCHCGQHIVH
ncbi:MAG: SDR family oxidoreductase [Syntrophorhabdaceae bacterium]|nr:SDR family oxidoreductase [Syntrophorhabdaceae bacterium]